MVRYSFEMELAKDSQIQHCFTIVLTWFFRLRPRHAFTFDVIMHEFRNMTYMVSFRESEMMPRLPVKQTKPTYLSPCFLS